MRRPSAVRLLIGLGGVTLIGVGIFNSLAVGFMNLLWLGFWLAAGLVLHDGVLAPGTAAVSKLAADKWSAAGRRSLLVALVCIGSLTLIALPLVIQHNAVPGNPTLLGRNYLLGWALACLLVLAGAGVAEVIGRVRANEPRDNPQPLAESTVASTGPRYQGRASKLGLIAGVQPGHRRDRSEDAHEPGDRRDERSAPDRPTGQSA